MNYYPRDMEIQGQNNSQNHVTDSGGSMVNPQMKGDKDSINGGVVAASQVGSVYVTIANSAVASESINAVEAGPSLTTSTYSSPACVSMPQVIQTRVQETTTVVIPPNLPEGCSLLIGEDNSQY